MLRVTGGGQWLLVGLLFISIPLPALAHFERLLTPVFDVEVPLHVNVAISKARIDRRHPFPYSLLVGADAPLVTGASPTIWSTAERMWQQFGKERKHTRTVEAIKDEKANSVYARLAEVRIEGMKRQRPVATTPSILRIPTIQLLDCRTLTDEKVCKGLMCTWEAARCHETTASASPASAAAQSLSNVDERALKLGDSFRECENCPEMLVVPAGRFMMGSPVNDRQRQVGETQVQVSIAAPFAVGKYAVSFDEWDACVADHGCKGYMPADQGWGRGKRPVINVSWDDANAYVAWIARKTGKTYRLLSDAEREYVTRANTTAPYWWGSSIRTTQANYNGEFDAYEDGSKGEYRAQTVSVDSFEPNAWGLYQVHGNVWEWVEDCWNDGNDGNSADGSARTAGDCARRVVRGGSWRSYPQSLRSAGRDGIAAAIQSFDVGFRVARTLEQ